MSIYTIMIGFEVNNNNLHLLPGKISQIAVRYSKEFNISLLDAIRQIYKSRTYKLLACEETKLWHLGPVALYEYLLEHH